MTSIRAFVKVLVIGTRILYFCGIFMLALLASREFSRGLQAREKIAKPSSVLSNEQEEFSNPFILKEKETPPVLTLPILKQQGRLQQLRVIFLLDNSGSMRFNDPKHHRLTTILDLLEQKTNRRPLFSSLQEVALIAFNEQAELWVPLSPVKTFVAKLRRLVGELKPRTIHPEQGLAGKMSKGRTDLNAPFTLLEKMIKEEKNNLATAVILLSDGVPSVTYHNGHRFLKKEGIPLFTIGYNQFRKNGITVRTKNTAVPHGKIPQDIDFDETFLRKLADESNGRFMTASEPSIQKVYHEMVALIGEELSPFRLSEFKSLYGTDELISLIYEFNETATTGEMEKYSGERDLLSSCHVRGTALRTAGDTHFVETSKRDMDTAKNDLKAFTRREEVGDAPFYLLKSASARNNRGDAHSSNSQKNVTQLDFQQRALASVKPAKTVYRNSTREQLRSRQGIYSRHHTLKFFREERLAKLQRRVFFYPLPEGKYNLSLHLSCPTLGLSLKQEVRIAVSTDVRPFLVDGVGQGSRRLLAFPHRDYVSLVAKRRLSLMGIDYYQNNSQNNSAEKTRGRQRQAQTLQNLVVIFSEQTQILAKGEKVLYPYTVTLEKGENSAQEQRYPYQTTFGDGIIEVKTDGGHYIFELKLTKQHGTAALPDPTIRRMQHKRMPFTRVYQHSFEGASGSPVDAVTEPPWVASPDMRALQLASSWARPFFVKQPKNALFFLVLALVGCAVLFKIFSPFLYKKAKEVRSSRVLAGTTDRLR